MQVYLAGCEGMDKNIFNEIPKDGVNYILISFFYLKNNEQLQHILDKTKYKLLIDSGAFSFRHGKNVDFDEYTKEYIKFIKENTDNPKIEGFFEMDIDNIVGYEKVLEYRKQLEEVSNKIIPVWHYNRGIKDYIEMCEQRPGKRIAVTTTTNEISRSQYNKFINTAHHYGCKIHLLGCTKWPLIKDLNLGLEDSVDSTRWIMASIYGNIDVPLPNKTMYMMDFIKGFKINNAYVHAINFYFVNRMSDLYLSWDNSIPV